MGSPTTKLGPCLFVLLTNYLNRPSSGVGNVLIIQPVLVISDWVPTNLLHGLIETNSS